MKNILNNLKIVLIATIIATGVSYVNAEWKNPTQSPTGANTPEPINVSLSLQTKIGDFESDGDIRAGLSMGANSFCLPGVLPTGGCISQWPSGGDNNNDSIIDGWPDGIVCHYVNKEGKKEISVFIIGFMDLANSNKIGYHTSQKLDSSNPRESVILFNDDGTYNSWSASGVGKSACYNKTISQLIEEGRTFNF